MQNRDYKSLFYLLLFATFVVNFVQAATTGILSDEAYYGLYGANLSWGYFDHPPVVGLLVHISSLFFDGALGIRFATTLIHLVTLSLLWRLTDDRSPDRSRVILFFVLASATVMFSVYGFATTPDAPLLLFTALFLLAYRRFLQQESAANIFWLALSMSGMVYSKYQAALVIGFVILSNLRLLLNLRFWLSGFLGLALLFPHFYWQYAHDFPGFKYHLVDRAGAFKWRYIYEYIPNEMAVFNPFVLGAAIYLLFRFKAKDKEERAYYFLITGFLLFFWLTGFRGHIEPHWTIAAAIPMLVLIYRRSLEHPPLLRYVRRFIFPSLLLVMAARVAVVVNPDIKYAAGFDKRKAEYLLTSRVAGNLPVLYTGSFQAPSMYSYFTGKKCFLLSSLDTRRTQFDFWQWERDFHNKPVFVCADIPGRSRKYSCNGTTISGFRADSLQTVTRMELTYTQPPVVMRAGQTIALRLTLHNPYPHAIRFRHREFPVTLSAAFLFRKETHLQPIHTDVPLIALQPGSSVSLSVSFVVPPLPAGKYHFGISLTNPLGASLNGPFTPITLK